MMLSSVSGQSGSGNTTHGRPTTTSKDLRTYDAANTLIAAATYSIAVRPGITGIAPTSSPAFGGQLITVNGSASP